MIDIFAVMAAERRALADDVEKLTDAQWVTPSALKGWQLRHVASHLVWPLESGPLTLGAAFFKAGMSFSRTVDNAAEADRRSPREMAAALRAQADNKKVPPGIGAPGILMDLLVHSLDIRRPLGLQRVVDKEALVIALKRLAGARSLKFFRIPSGFTFVATDVGWRNGQGPVVEGNSQDLLLALAGRKAGLAGLGGDGAPQFRERFKEYG
jgi:uncharacterized protein (TIGR03083 family)